jgi:HSP20 family protein
MFRFTRSDPFGWERWDPFRWDPFRDVFRTSSAWDWLFSQPLSSLRPSLSQPTLAQTGGFAYDVVEDGDGYIIRAALPGIHPDDLELTLAGQTLTIRGESQEPELPSSARYHWRERATGRFERSIQFAVPVEADGVQSSYTNGLLTVYVPKTEAFRPRRIPVQTQPLITEGKPAPALEEKTAMA